MKKYFYDLHIHSALSPCADDDMTPANIVAMAKLKQLDIIAVSDHNSCLNCEAVKQCAGDAGILAVPAMELNTSEEIHVLCFFKTIEDAAAFSEYVYSNMPNITNKPDVYGHQYVMDKDERILREVDKLLITASSIELRKVQKEVTSFNGICVPAHIDKSSYSLISVLGTVPEEYNFDGFEIADIEKKDKIIFENKALCDKIILTSSDAHYLWQINERVNSIELEEKSIEAFFDKFEHFRR